MYEDLSYDAMKRAGDFLLNSLGSSKSTKSKGGFFFISLVQTKMFRALNFCCWEEK